MLVTIVFWSRRSVYFSVTCLILKNMKLRKNCLRDCISCNKDYMANYTMFKSGISDYLKISAEWPVYKQNTHIYLSKNLCFRVKICLLNSRFRVLKIILILPQNDFFREQDFHFPVVRAWVPEHSPDSVFFLLDPVLLLMTTTWPLPQVTGGKRVESLREEGQGEWMWLFLELWPYNVHNACHWLFLCNTPLPFHRPWGPRCLQNSLSQIRPFLPPHHRCPPWQEWWEDTVMVSLHCRW